MKHDWETTEQYKDGIFMGDLFKCKSKNCGEEHLCTQNKKIGPNCTHVLGFDDGCPSPTDTPEKEECLEGAECKGTCKEAETAGKIELNSFNHQFVIDGWNAGFTDAQLNFLSEYFFNQK